MQCLRMGKGRYVAGYHLVIITTFKLIAIHYMVVIQFCGKHHYNGRRMQ